MRIPLFLFFLTTLCITSNAQNVNFEWAGKIGSNMQDQGEGIAVDTFGNVYTVGIFEGTCDFDPGTGSYPLASLGGKDIFISKFSSTGNFIWAKKVGKNNDDYGNAIAVDDSGNVYTTGYFAGAAVDFDPGPGTYAMSSAGGFNDIFILKLDASGNFVWAKQIGSNNTEYGFSITVDQFGAVYTTGAFNASCDFDPGPGVFTLSPHGIYILKLSTDGNFIWAKQFGGIYSSEAWGITTDPGGNVYTAGYFDGMADFDPSAAFDSLTTFGGYDIYVSKLDSAGNFIWAKQMGGPGDDRANALAVDTAGNVYVAGSFHVTCDFDPGTAVYNLTSAGTWDIFVEKLDVNGDFEWAFRLGAGSTGNDDQAFGIDVDDSGNVYTTGNFLGTVDFDPGPSSYPLMSGNTSDIFIQKVNTNGSFVWAGDIGSGSFNTNIGNAITVDQDANIYATGSFVSTGVDFDPGGGVYALSTSGGYDAFVLKLGAGITTGLQTGSNVAFSNIYPNPSNGAFKLQIEPAIQSGNFLLFNSLGQQVYITKITGGENNIVVDGLKSGLYTYVLMHKQAQIATGKMAVE